MALLHGQLFQIIYVIAVLKFLIYFYFKLIIVTYSNNKESEHRAARIQLSLD